MEELKGCEEDDNLSQLAEEIVKQAFIEKRVDRLLQDIEAESPGLDDQEEQDAKDSESPDSSESKPK